MTAKTYDYFQLLREKNFTPETRLYQKALFALDIERRIARCNVFGLACLGEAFGSIRYHLT